MKRYCIEVELVTPCISSGVDQSVAEFRAPSIRGELRSWFRWLGGSRDQEQAVFGGVHGEAPSASQVIVRVTTSMAELAKARDFGDCEKISGNKLDYFLWPFGTTKSSQNPRGFLKAGTRVSLQILDKSDSALFERALKAFLLLGSMGSRSRRACGSVWPVSVTCDGVSWDLPTDVDGFKHELAGLKLPRTIGVNRVSGVCRGWRDAVSMCADLLHRARCGSARSGDAIQPSELGGADKTAVRNRASGSILHRPALGFPMNQRFKNGDTYETKISKHDSLAYDDKDCDRWASPILFKVVKLENGFVPLMLVMYEQMLPEGTLLSVYGRGSRIPVMDCTSDNQLFMLLAEPSRYGEINYQGAAAKLYPNG